VRAPLIIALFLGIAGTVSLCVFSARSRSISEPSAARHGEVTTSSTAVDESVPPMLFTVSEPERADAAVTTPERVPVPAQVQGDGDGQLERAPEPTVTAAPLDPAVAQLLGDQRVRIGVLEAEIERLRAELDECRDGPYSVLGTLHALPEWAGLEKGQRAIVLDFLRRFPVLLSVGEATLIATHASPTGDTTREIISMLGRARVLASMSPEARAKLQKDDPDEFEDYFGR